MTRLSAPSPDELPVVSEPDFLLGARVVVRANDAAAVVQLTDPEVGDRLQVVPLPTPGQAVTLVHDYPDLEILPAFQGIVVRPVADAVTVRPVKEGVELTAAGGMHLSPLADQGVQPVMQAQVEQPRPQGQGASPPAQGASPTQTAARPSTGAQTGQSRRLFDLPAWQRGGLDRFTDNRQALQTEIVDVPESDRGKKQLELARFYFANGFGQEALGVLEVLQSAEPDLQAWPEFKALRGGARVLAGDLEKAAADFADANLSSNAEAELWRAAMAAQRYDWPAAAAGFKAANKILAGYPEPLNTRFSLMAAEAALNVRDTAEARAILDRVTEKGGLELEERPAVRYLRGMQLAQSGKPDEASEELTAAYQSEDHLYRARAGLALVNLELAEGRMSPAAAVERLAGLTYAWRGDDLELDIRERLGEVQVAAGQYADGWTTMKETAALAGEGPRAERMVKEMAHSFAELFKDGAEKIPPLDALQLYDHFRELTPVGKDGDDMVRQLAERLIQIDLLSRAADLLEHQVEYRLSGMDKAKVGTRLASVRLLDGKPEQAVRALGISNVPGMPPDLSAERQLMQAKALASMGKSAEALALLAQDDSRPANLLRVDIAWRNQMWEQAAVALAKVIGAPPLPDKPIDEETTQLVLNRAVAMALAGDASGLNQLRREFGPAMARGPEADAFRVLTRPEQATGLIDAASIRSRVAEVDVFQKFLKGYRNRQAAEQTPPAGPVVN